MNGEVRDQHCRIDAPSLVAIAVTSTGPGVGGVAVTLAITANSKGSIEDNIVVDATQSSLCRDVTTVGGFDNGVTNNQRYDGRTKCEGRK